MGKKKCNSATRVSILAERLTGFILKELLDARASYEEACLALKIVPNLLEATSQSLPGRCFSDVMTAYTRTKLEEQKRKTGKRTEVKVTRRNGG
jgi:hypothetical protein